MNAAFFLFLLGAQSRRSRAKKIKRFFPLSLFFISIEAVGFLLLLQPAQHRLRTEAQSAVLGEEEQSSCFSVARTMEMPPIQRGGRLRRRRRHRLRAIFTLASVVALASIAIAVSSSPASAQQLPVPAPDSLEKWAAAQQEKTTASSASPLGPQFSFVRAPRPRNGNQQGTPGVALGGSGGGGGKGAASKARAAFVGLGDPLPPGLAKRWKDPSVPIDIDTEEVRKEVLEEKEKVEREDREKEEEQKLTPHERKTGGGEQNKTN